MPFITLIVLYKSPILLFKGWNQLLHDLIGREGPFFETICVPFAGLLILLWPIVVVLAALAGVISSFFFGCYAAVIAYQVLFQLSSASNTDYLIFVLSCSSLVSLCVDGYYAYDFAMELLQESSIKRGLLYIVASMSLFDESTNDFLYLREGSCFPRYSSFASQVNSSWIIL